MAKIEKVLRMCGMMLKKSMKIFLALALMLQAFVSISSSVSAVGTGEIEVYEEEPFTLTVVNGATGTRADPGPATIEVVAGQEIWITADVREGYWFSVWQVSGASDSFGHPWSNTTTFQMPSNPTSDITITAYFFPIPSYTVTVEGGTGSGEFLVGSTVPIRAVEPLGYSFLRWEAVTPRWEIVFANPYSRSTTFEVPLLSYEEIIVRAVFIPEDRYQDALNSARDHMGNIPMSRDRLMNQLVEDGYTESQARGVAWVFDHEILWYEVAVENGRNHLEETPGMTRDQLITELTSTFERFTPSQAEHVARVLFDDYVPRGGWMVVNVIGGTGSGRFSDGEEGIISAIIPEGYRFSHWRTRNSGGIDEYAATTTFQTLDNRVNAFYAVFVPDLPIHTVIVQNGFVDVESDYDNEFEVGSTVHIYALIPQGQRFSHWEEVDPPSGVEDISFNLFSSTIVASASFTMPDRDVTIRAIFEPIDSDSTQPEATDPTVPDSTQPEATDPTIPDSTQPEATDPTIPDSTQPETTDPTVPDSTRPTPTDPTEPETTSSAPTPTDPTEPETTSSAPTETTSTEPTDPATTGPNITAPIRDDDRIPALGTLPFNVAILGTGALVLGATATLMKRRESK